MISLQQNKRISAQTPIKSYGGEFFTIDAKPIFLLANLPIVPKQLEINSLTIEKKIYN
jgi:hypothetical protein